jgi:hypothetical protein
MNLFLGVLHAICCNLHLFIKGLEDLLNKFCVYLSDKIKGSNLPNRSIRFWQF